MRPASWTRTYQAPAVDAAIDRLLPQFKDKNLGTLFANSLPNALDSTAPLLFPSSPRGVPIPKYEVVCG